MLEIQLPWLDELVRPKKPVRLPFVDFSDAGERERLCHAELTLNRRLAPSLYLGVVPVTGTETRPRLGGEGRALEHAVHMRRFDARDEAPTALADGRIDAAVVGAFGARLADFHEGAETLQPGEALARPRDLLRAWRDDVDALGPLAAGERGERLQQLDTAWREAFARGRERIAARRRAGRVRACHGDLHLANLVLLDGGLTAFDCIEFNDEFRYVDVVSELAFLVMDLERLRRPLLAHAFLDGWLQAAGDYDGLALLPLFSAYRASVRAKIAALRLAQLQAADERRRERATMDGYLRLAARLLEPPSRRPRLLVMHGLSGSGKSRLARELAAADGYLRIRSDVERRRLFDVESAPGQARAYAPEGVRATYRRMADHAALALDAGFDVIADATFTAPEQRRRFYGLAERCGADVLLVALRAPTEVLEQRVAERAEQGADASQADVEVLRRQLASYAPAGAGEGAARLLVDTADPIDVTRLAARVRRLARPPRQAL